MSSIYTGRKVAIFSDVHGLLEPLEATLSDIDKRGITEIYSLGDNIGVGPSPCEVIDTIRYFGVKSVAGNAEEYCTLGIAPFRHYFNEEKMLYQMWTYSKLGDYRLDYIRNLYHSYELELGGKKIALCHFANDIRTDYGLNGTDKYLNNFASGEAYKQFFYTNSKYHFANIKYNIEKYGIDNPDVRGYVSARDYPIFDGKTVGCFDMIIQGHVHRNLYEKGDGVEFHTIRAMGLHYDYDPIDMAFYIILNERIDNGFDIKCVYVPFDREKMENTILKSDEPTKKIKKMVRMNI